ncbi:MAG: DUF418 domain-containing protein [Acidobacteria bacterium]|nr:DUF418 domain-containing protein [Acidobacteriota bacterium]
MPGEVEPFNPSGTQVPEAVSAPLELLQPASPAAAVPAPVTATERISSIDVLRGVALLGILLMNILTWALPEAAYWNPRVAGGHTGINLAAWYTQYVLFDGKMRAIFSLVFGASVFLLISRLEQQGAGLRAADIYYRRLMWLMVFGIAHAYLIWHGDILYPYALIGLILFPLRVLRPRTLFIIAGVQLVLLTGMSVGRGFHLRSVREKALAADAADKRKVKLTDEQKEAQKQWKEILKEAQPPPEELKKETDAWRGNYLQVFQRRAKIVSGWHSMPFYIPFFWDMMSFMLIGIGLLKLRVLHAERSWRFYGVTAGAGYALGVTLNAISGWLWIRSNFDLMTGPFTSAPYQIGRVPVALAHVAVVMMLVKGGALRWLTSRLAAVGQMAFSNYIATSLICGFLFYGYGLGMFGKFERYQVYAIVPAIWTLNLLVSSIWLKHFRFGPLEWCWRSLVYWKRQPMWLTREKRFAQTTVAAAG